VQHVPERRWLTTAVTVTLGTFPQERFEDNADMVAVAKRAGDSSSFPEYFHVARELPEETELQVHEDAVRTKEKGRPITMRAFVGGEWADE